MTSIDPTKAIIAQKESLEASSEINKENSEKNKKKDSTAILFCNE